MAKRTPKKPKDSQPQDAVQLLKADHRQVRKLFEQFHGASDDDKGSIAKRLFIELDIHSKLEEELLYPAVQSKLDALDSESQGNGLDITDDGEVEQIGDALAHAADVPETTPLQPRYCATLSATVCEMQREVREAQVARDSSIRMLAGVDPARASAHKPLSDARRQRTRGVKPAR